MDDFAWLGLHTLIHDYDSFIWAMFTPLAQGTIRPLSERLFFVAGWHLFGLESPPFRAFVFATMFGCLALLNAITRRLTGSALAVFGLAFETLGDWQLVRFKKDPANEGRVMDKGLWRYTRHPNYFGDACTWWGLWLVAAETQPGLFAIVGPILLTFTLTRWSGAPTTEGRMKRRKPDYEDYMRRTSAFVPWPPKPPLAP